MMSRVKLEQLNILELRRLAWQQNLDIEGDRAVLFDRLTDHFERNGWSEQIIRVGQNYTEDRNHTEIEKIEIVEEDSFPCQEAVRADTHLNVGPDDLNLNQQVASRNVEGNVDTRELYSPNIQEIVQATVLQVLKSNHMIMQLPNNANLRRQNSEASLSEVSVSNESQDSMLHNWNRIELISKLIPTFTGKEEDNVITWLERIASIGRLYKITEQNILVPAAINKLSGQALEWFNCQSVDSIATWEDFKFHLREYFQRKETVTMTLTKRAVKPTASYNETCIHCKKPGHLRGIHDCSIAKLTCNCNQIGHFSWHQHAQQVSTTIDISKAELYKEITAIVKKVSQQSKENVVLVDLTEREKEVGNLTIECLQNRGKRKKKATSEESEDSEEEEEEEKKPTKRNPPRSMAPKKSFSYHEESANDEEEYSPKKPKVTPKRKKSGKEKKKEGSDLPIPILKKKRTSYVRSTSRNRDSDEDWGKNKRAQKLESTAKKNGGKNKRDGFTRLVTLSPELAALVGAAQMTRDEVVRKVWSYIKQKNLYDPGDKQYTICDDELMKIINVNRFKTFSMRKYLKNHW